MYDTILECYLPQTFNKTLILDETEIQYQFWPKLLANRNLTFSFRPKPKVPRHWEFAYFRRRNRNRRRNSVGL